MTDTENWNEPGYEDQGTDLVKDLRKQLRDKAAAEQDLAKKIATLEGQVRKQTIHDVLTTRGVPVKLAAFVPSDIEPTAEGVGKWLEEYGDVFNITAPEGTADKAASVVGQDQQEAITTMQDVTHSAEAANTGGPVTEADLRNAPDLEALRALMARGG